MTENAANKSIMAMQNLLRLTENDKGIDIWFNRFCAEELLHFISKPPLHNQVPQRSLIETWAKHTRELAEYCRERYCIDILPVEQLCSELKTISGHRVSIS